MGSVRKQTMIHLYHCSHCHHEWESGSDESTCDWCHQDGYILTSRLPFDLLKSFREYLKERRHAKTVRTRNHRS